MTVLKNLVSPVQGWLLTQGRCVGCGTPLTEGSKGKNGLVSCKCGRIYKTEGQTFRRARLDEVK